MATAVAAVAIGTVTTVARPPGTVVLMESTKVLRDLEILPRMESLLDLNSDTDWSRRLVTGALPPCARLCPGRKEETVATAHMNRIQQKLRISTN